MGTGFAGRHRAVPGSPPGNASLSLPRRIVVIVVLAAIVSPAVRDHDSFPLSTYPMYAYARGDDAVIATAVGFDASGTERRLSMSTIAQTDDPLIAESLVARAIRTGQAPALCAEIAARAAEAVATVEVVEEHHNVVKQAAGEQSLLDRTVHARCEVPR